MVDIIRLLVGAILRLFRTRRSLLLENLALRQQLAVLKRKHPRPKLAAFDKLFWTAASRSWSQWKTSSHRCHARYGGPMASGRFPSVLETDFQGQEARREKTDSEGSAAVDLQDGC